MNNPVVSVVMITYGHEKHIDQAIDGVLMQQTKFRVELIIANDHSPDNTDTIVRKYIDENPNKKLIKYFNHTRNLGMMPNVIFALNQSSGKYTAFCEGDDYWIDPLKLQKQVDFLEKNPDYGLVHADCNFFYENTGKWEYNANRCLIDLNKHYDKEVLFNKLINGTYKIRTATVLLRRDLLNKIEPKEFQFLMGDTPLWLMLSQITSFKYINEVFSVYRIRAESASRSVNKSKQLQFQLSMVEVRIYYSLKYGFPLSESLTKKYNEALIKYLLYVPGYRYIYPPITPNAYQRFELNQIRKGLFLWLFKGTYLTTSLFKRALRRIF